MKSKKSPSLINANLTISIDNEPTEFNVNVPKKRASAQCVIPFGREITNAAVDKAEANSIAAGKPISCKKGCGACCKQLVPISATEARYLVKKIAQQPSAKREAIMKKFEAAEQTLKAAGVWETLLTPEKLAKADIQAFGLDYFDIGLDCPFLEDNACSIHQERPLTCREFLATSPAEHCATPRTQQVETVAVPVKFSKAIATIDQGMKSYQTEWVALPTIFSWVKKHPEPSPSKTGPQWIEKFLAQI